MGVRARFLLLSLGDLLVAQPRRQRQPWLKVQELRKLIAGGGCTLIQNHKGHAEENAHATDLDENIRFVVPILFSWTMSLSR
jgi:hypothetical protein